MASNTVELIISVKDLSSRPLNTVGNSMRRLGRGFKSFTTGFKRSFTDFDRTAASMGERLGLLINPITILIASFAALGKAIKGTVGAAIDFEKELANVSTLVDTSEVSMEAMASGVKRLSTEVNQMPVDLLKGAFQVISATGKTGAEALEILQTSARLATAGQADLAISVRAVTGALNAYGLEASEAGRISDVVFKTMEHGVVTVEELSSVLGVALSSAATLGVSFEEVGAATAAITKAGISADIATTSLNNAFVSLIKSADKFRDSGVDILEVVSEKGLIGALNAMKDLTKGNVEELLKFIPNIRSLRAVLALTGNQYETYQDILKDTRNATGATAIAFEKQTDTLDGSLKELKITFNLFAIFIGNTFLPAIKSVIDAYLELGRIIGITAAIIVGKLEPSFTSFFDGLARKSLEMEKAFSDLATDTGSIFIAIGLVITDTFKKISENTKTVLTNIGINLGEFGVQAINGIILIFSEITTFVKSLAETLWVPFVVGFEGVGRSLVDIFNQAMKVIQGQADITSIDAGAIFERNLREAMIRSGDAGKDAFDELSNSLLRVADAFAVVLTPVGELITSISRDVMAQAMDDIGRFVEMFKEAYGKEIPDAAKDGWKEVNKLTDEWFGFTRDTMIKVSDISKAIFQSFSQGIGDAFAQAIVYGESLTEAFDNLGKRILSSLISMVIQMGVQHALQATVAAAINSEKASTEMASAAGQTYANTFVQVSATPYYYLAPGIASAQTTAMLSGAAASGTAGSAVGSSIASQEGQADDGISSIPRRGTYILDDNERVLSADQNRDFTKFMKDGGRNQNKSVVVQNLNISMGDKATKMSSSEMRRFVRTKVLPAINELGKAGATVTTKYRRSTT